MSKMYAISVYYNGYDAAVDERIEKILGPRAASGCMIGGEHNGERDLAWYFNTKKERDSWLAQHQDALAELTDPKVRWDTLDF